MAAVSKTQKLVAPKGAYNTVFPFKCAPIRMPAPEIDLDPSIGIQPMPNWADDFRGCPSDFLRGNLFGLARKEKEGRKFLKSEPINCQRGMSITFTGQQLDQNDLNVLLALMHVTREQFVGESVRFFVDQKHLLDLCNLTNSGSNIKALHERIIRLQGSVIVMITPKRRYSGQLLGPAAWDERTNVLSFVMYKSIADLLPNGSYTGLNWKVRQALSGYPLAQWLHAFYQSHVNPHPMLLETIHKLCGSEAKEMRVFKQSVGEALKKVEAAHKAINETFTASVVKEKAGYKVYVIQPQTSLKKKYAKVHDVMTASCAKAEFQAMREEDGEEEF